jgi:hypothetical protein
MKQKIINTLKLRYEDRYYILGLLMGFIGQLIFKFRFKGILFIILLMYLVTLIGNLLTKSDTELNELKGESK